jgi:dihydroneopterin aldolase/2-amino-4-hydroxy-6-hydroxymethyldihydropteridine diphosphokinase
VTVIRVRGLSFFAFHGVLEEEKRLGQRFRLDLEAVPWSDRAEATDAVADAVHYGELAERAVAVATAERYDLLERLGARIADVLFAEFPLRSVRVCLGKPSAPVPLSLDTVVVEVFRSAAEDVVVALGANLGAPEPTLRAAVDELAATVGVDLVARSRIYRTAPVGGPEQPSYLNAAVRLTTRLGPHALLDRLQAIEQAHGRTREVRFGARTLDLDLLLYGGRTVADERLVVPHPRLAERRFALVPLLDVLPDAAVAGRSARVLAEAPEVAAQELRAVGWL